MTGTALAPRIRLYADPDMPDADKLAWLVLGRSPAAGGAESAVLQQAALVLLGAMMWWEATQGRPQIINTINDGWRAADKEHQERIDVIQKRADDRLDKLVERHSEAIQGLREAMLGQRKAVSSVDAPVAAPQQ